MSVFKPKPEILAMLEHLHQASLYASDLGVDVAEICSAAKTASDFGVTEIDVKWLLMKGFVRRLDVESSTGCCFAITDSGCEFLQKNKYSEKTPKWHVEKRQLTFDGLLIKEFRVPSSNQETVLRAFEEEGWPRRIFDPLVPKHGVAAKSRVSETIKSMNRWHKEKAIRFFGDGTGRGICWRREDMG